MRLTRRHLLTRLLPRTLAGALAGTAVASCTAPGPPIVVSAGEPGGIYVEFADLLVARLAAAGVPARSVESGGSVDNLRRIADGSAVLGLSLVDAAQSAVAGTAPFDRPLPMRALGRVYENYMQLVVRAEDPFRSVADLAGRPVSLGAAGSGAATFGDRLLAAAGVDAGVERRPLREATAALASGATDALLWSGGVPTPALVELAASRPIRLLPLADQLPALRAAFGAVYGPATVPADGYAGVPAAVHRRGGQSAGLPAGAGGQRGRADRHRAGHRGAGAGPRISTGHPVPRPALADRHRPGAAAPRGRRGLSRPARMTLQRAR